MSYPASRQQAQVNRDLYYQNSAVKGYNPSAIDPVTQQYGPCSLGGYHDIRYHYKTRDLLFAFLIFPVYCFRSKDIVCKKCKKKLGST